MANGLPPRTPTDRDALWAWWREHRSSAPDEVPNEPQCGLYKIRAKDRTWRAAAIDLLQDVCPETGELLSDEKLVAFVNTRDRQWERDPDEAWGFMAKNPVSEADHFRLLHQPQVTDLSRSIIV